VGAGTFPALQPGMQPPKDYLIDYLAGLTAAELVSLASVEDGDETRELIRAEFLRREWHVEAEPPR
jgi:hypothetical protein